MMNKIFVLSFFSIVSLSVSLPPHRRADTHVEENKVEHNEGYPDMEELGIEYTRYLRQVIETLEKDETFKKKLENAEEHDIKSARIAEELEYVNHHVRTKLDELKRTELHRLRELAKQAYHPNADSHSAFGHVDHDNPNTFEIQDLKKLIRKTAEDLEEADRRRKEEFKTYEMEKHFEREQKLKNMTEEERKKFIQHEEELRRKEETVAKQVHHPGSKQQLEEVWENQDHMNKDDFNPRTFFAMHDIDNNGFLDEEEIKALFVKELDKLYASGSLHGDAVERAEEMERMREHVFNEVDKNRDRLISWEEFYAMSAQPNFTEDPGWQPIDNNDVYTNDEWQVYEQQRMNEMETLRRAGQLPNQAYYPDQHNGGYPNPNVPYGANGHAQQYYPQQGAHPQQDAHQQAGGYAPHQMNGYPQNYPQPPAGYAQPQAVPQGGQHYQNQGVPPQQHQVPYQNQVPQPNALPQQHAVPVQPVAAQNVPQQQQQQQQPVQVPQMQQPPQPQAPAPVQNNGAANAQSQQPVAPQHANNVNVQPPVGGQFQFQGQPEMKVAHDQQHFESKTN